MATIDRDRLIQDELMWLPPSNVFTDLQMASINELVISNEIPADDDIYYAETLCKALRALGVANKAKATASSNGLRRDKVDTTELEWFSEQGPAMVWQDFIDSLRDVCPLFGYYGLSTKGGIKINNTIPEYNPNPLCTNNDDMEF